MGYFSNHVSGQSAPVYVLSGTVSPGSSVGKKHLREFGLAFESRKIQPGPCEDYVSGLESRFYATEGFPSTENIQKMERAIQLLHALIGEHFEPINSCMATFSVSIFLLRLTV